MSETLAFFRKRKSRRIWEEARVGYGTYFLEEYLSGFMTNKNIIPFHFVKTCAAGV